MTNDLNNDNETTEERCLFSEVYDIKITIEDMNARFARIEYKIDEIKKPLDLELRVAQANATLDKFDNYMRNLEKCNIMVNELKGQVALVRSAIKAMQNEKYSINKRYQAALKSLFAGLKDTDSE